ncbi:MAG TPA: alpha-1,4-glucan--maltose-1-phosphate maltosyltransferase, partial [Thermodesulfobacteriota bacterium]|nr:alpha-1,4-glucan--maltose-1-phosphate maltosyltransferase [Thermodesulfobacteriota bacterium]
MQTESRCRAVIENVDPEVDCGRFPVKRVAGERVSVSADIFADGHDALSAALLYRFQDDSGWRESPMAPGPNDRWAGEFTVSAAGTYFYSVLAWVSGFMTWQADFRKKKQAGQDTGVEIAAGARLVREASGRAEGADREKLLDFARALEGEDDSRRHAVALDAGLASLMARHDDRRRATRYGRELAVTVDRKKAGCSAWYELFPRSAGPPGRHGTFRDVEAALPEIARMGFDVLYLPPIHPIGKKNRKGKNNALQALPEDVGSPWAVGSEEGGHKAVHPLLGTLADFDSLVRKAEAQGMEIAMDLAFQCSPDHPYVREHPEWFRWRPDGKVQFAENPPKKYEDIVPFDFECDSWESLWEELKSVVLFWIDLGVRIFRVDNPHTKPFRFWAWLIGEVKRDFPEVLFLAEAFTRPKVMYRLAKLGFSQSYTYFTWRNSKRELTEYLDELTRTKVKEYFRPNFWPNTPDILPEFLQIGGRPAFLIRLILAATLSSNYGIYGPPFEAGARAPLPGREEYDRSEKYEIRNWPAAPEGLRDLISRVNRIRAESPALQQTGNLRFVEAGNDFLLAYGKTSEGVSEIILSVVNLDPFHPQAGWVTLPMREWGLDPEQPYLLHELISDDKFI